MGSGTTPPRRRTINPMHVRRNSSAIRATQVARDSEHSDAVHDLPKRKATMPTVKVSSMLLHGKSQSMEPKRKPYNQQSPDKGYQFLRTPNVERMRT